MKVILRDGVTGLGEAGAVVEVAAGYARLFLSRPASLPSRPPAATCAISIRCGGWYSAARTGWRTLPPGIANRLGELNLVMRAKSGEDGRLDGSITTTDIAEALQERHELEVDKRKMEIPEPIRVVGSHEVKDPRHPEVEDAHGDRGARGRGAAQADAGAGRRGRPGRGRGAAGPRARRRGAAGGASRNGARAGERGACRGRPQPAGEEPAPDEPSETAEPETE